MIFIFHCVTLQTSHWLNLKWTNATKKFKTVLTNGNRPLALRGHVTNASLKQWVVLLLMPKIDRAHKSYLTPEIWEETHLREIFYSTLIFQQSSMICMGRHVGGQFTLLARRPSSRPKDGQFSDMGDFRRPVLGGHLRTSMRNVTKSVYKLIKLTFLLTLKSCFSVAVVFFFYINPFFASFLSVLIKWINVERSDFTGKAAVQWYWLTKSSPGYFVGCYK